jgi:signal transduction histidine kinase
MSGIEEEQKTHYAAPERSSPEELGEDLRRLSADPVVDGLLQMSSGLLAILNEHRQILAVNEALLELLGVEDSGAVFGLRPGEALHCVHAAEGPNGCGTGVWCASCGAAIALVTSLAEDAPVERRCAATLERNGSREDACFAVRSVPVEREGLKLLLLFIQDVSREEQRIALERTFLHDLNNTVAGLMGTCQLSRSTGGTLDAETASTLFQLAARLTDEVTLQRQLLTEMDEVAFSGSGPVEAETILSDIRATLEHHPAAADRSLLVVPLTEPIRVQTHFVVLERVLTNLVVNALEATPEGGTVRIGCNRAKDRIVFYVHGPTPIPTAIQRRIFQKHFTTKEGGGHGFGTYSARLFTEKLLKGRVTFRSGEQAGTTFYIELPDAEA